MLIRTSDCSKRKAQKKNAGTYFAGEGGYL